MRVASSLRAVARAASSEARRVPTYGREGAFFVGETATSGRGAYAARDFAVGEAVVVHERPLVCAPSRANGRAIACETCVRESGGERFCSDACARAGRVEFERERGIEFDELEARCDARALKFPLVVARAATMIASGSLQYGSLEFLVSANGVEKAPPRQWVEEWETLRRALARARPALEWTPSLEWYAKTTSRLHLNSFRVEIPPAMVGAGADFKSTMTAGIDAIARGAASGTAVYFTASLFNHSCAPNAHVSWENGDAAITIRTLRPVRAGEEFNITYVDANERSASRRARLKEWYGFDCACERCASGEDDDVDA